MENTIQRAKNLVLMARYGVFSSECAYGSSFENSFPFGPILFKNGGNVKAIGLNTLNGRKEGEAPLERR
jgi:hypothetical protein